VLVADARQYIYLFGAPNSVPLFCHSRRYLLSRAMEGGERDLKKRLKTTAAAMQGGWSRPEEDRRGDCGDLGDTAV